MMWWRRRAPEPLTPVVHVLDETELADARDREAAHRRRAQAEEALRSRLVTPSGHCVVDVLVAPWLSRERPWAFDVGPLPPAEVLFAAFRLLQDDPPVEVVGDFTTSEPVERRVFLPPPPSEGDRQRFLKERPGHLVGWRIPTSLDVTAHALAAERLRTLDARARRTGSPLPVEEALSNPRWWPGRQAEPRALANDFSSMFREQEARQVDVAWLRASHDAQDLLYQAVGLPSVSPEVWVVAATDYAVRRTAEQQS